MSELPPCAKWKRTRSTASKIRKKTRKGVHSLHLLTVVLEVSVPQESNSMNAKMNTDGIE